MASRISPHDSLVALLRASGVEASEADTGGGCLAVVAPLPEGGEAVMGWEGGEWGVSLTDAAGGCFWIGTLPSTEALMRWVFRRTGRVVGLATSGQLPPRDAAHPGPANPKPNTRSHS